MEKMLRVNIKSCSDGVGANFTMVTDDTVEMQYAAVDYPAI